MSEILAINQAVETTNTREGIHIKTDSKWRINQLTRNLPHLEDADFVGTRLIKDTVNSMRRRGDSITLSEWTKGHPGTVCGDTTHGG
jgi:hypothetical protein